MAMARPVVASPAAATGIDAVDGEHLIVAEGGAAMADALCRLFDDRALAVRMGAAARERMIARYGWEDRKSTRLIQSLMRISYAVFCLKKKKQQPLTRNNTQSKA